MLKNIKNKLKAVSLFSGCGGLDRGFINAGFEIIWANDFFPDAVETYKKNISNHIILGDIKKIKSSQIPENFDILLGGFPCQGFSIANKKRNMKDERNFLYREMLRIVKDKKPPFFLAENVKGLLSMSGGEVIKMIKKDFESLGYIVDYKLVNAADYGVPQQRERVLILGNRLGIKNEFPESTHGKDKKPYITTKEVVGYLANVLVSFDPQKHNNKLVYNHIARTNVQDNNSGSIPNPEDWWRLKKILEFDNKFDKQVTELELKPIKFEQSLRINNWDKPSDTITATGPEIHPNK